MNASACSCVSARYSASYVEAQPSSSARSRARAPKHGVAEQADRHASDVLEAVACDVGGELASLNGLVQGRQRLRAKERRCEELVLRRDLGPAQRPAGARHLRRRRIWSWAGIVCKALCVRSSLFEFAGGEPAFLALARAHHARCLADPELNHPFSHDDQHPQHVERLAAYWAEVMGGPPTYSETCGDESDVLTIHAGHGDMDDLGERFLACFVLRSTTPDCLTTPRFGRDARLHALGGRQRAVVLARGRSRPGAAEMPRWGWSGLARP